MKIGIKYNTNSHISRYKTSKNDFLSNLPSQRYPSSTASLPFPFLSLSDTLLQCSPSPVFPFSFYFFPIYNNILKIWSRALRA
jgi:hypothetical protein